MERVTRGVGLGVLVGLLAAGPARADDPALAELKARLDRLEKQNEELRQKLQEINTQGPYKPDDEAKQEKERVKKILGDYMKERDEKKKKDDEKKKKDEEAEKKRKEEKGYEVGTVLGMTGRYDPEIPGLRFSTPNNDFTFHTEARAQWDNVWFTQNRNLLPASQFGPLQDGEFFRRLRIRFDGIAYEVFEYNAEWQMEQVVQGVPGLDEIYAGVMKIPLIGTIRAGHMRVPQGFEGDQVSSSKAMTFLEKAPHTDAFYQNFAPGVWTGNSVLDQRLTWAGMLYRQENAFHGNSGADFGDGEYAMTGRVTGLPIYEEEGRHLLHLGLSGTWRKAERQDPGGADPQFVRLRARPTLRDATGDFGTTSVDGITNQLATANGALQLPGNTSRLVDTGNVQADAITVLGTELFYVMGPLSLQSEWAFAWINAPVVSGTRSGDLGFHGGYVQLSYFLTGENRGYDRRLGRSATTYIARPFTNAWVVRDEEGGLCCGTGAWELAARWSYLNLNDGPVQGGVMNAWDLGVNWYLSNNMKLQIEYMINERYNRPGFASGNVQGLGTRFQLLF
jgi:phosphate-selective porin OprO/OprP